MEKKKKNKHINELWMLKRLNKYKTCVHKLSGNIYSDCRSFVFGSSSSTIAMCLAYRCVNMLNNSTGWRWTTTIYDMWIDDEAVTWMAYFFRIFPFFSNSEFKSNLKLVFFLFSISGALSFRTKSFICFAMLDFSMIILRMEQKNTIRILIN